MLLIVMILLIKNPPHCAGDSCIKYLLDSYRISVTVPV